MDRVARVAFTGPFSDVNFGDYAMLVNNIYDLDIKDIVLFSYDRDFLNTIRREYLDDYDVEIVDVILKYGVSETLGTGGHKTAVPYELLSLVENFDDLVDVIRSVDVLIVNGGGYLNGLWSMPHRIARLVRIIVPIVIADQLNKRICFTGNSYGPFGEDSEFFACLFATLDNTTFYCRDNLYSSQWLRQLGVDGSQIRYVPDDLFPINPDLLGPGRCNDIKCGEYLVLESYLPVDYFKADPNALRDFSKTIFEEHGLNVVFLPFSVRQGGMDQAEYLDSILSHYEYYDTASRGYLPIQDAWGVIRNAKLVISSRYHAFLIALSAGTPAVNVLKDVMGDKRYYYNKSSGLLKEVLRGIEFDERLYFQSDYFDALAFVVDNFDAVIREQAKNYNEQYLSNKDRLSIIRRECLDGIAKKR